MRNSILTVGFLFLTYVLLAFPIFYFVYKFGDPEPLAHDFFQYYRLYKDWDIANVNAAFNMRLAGSAIVHLFYEAGFSYETNIAFDKYNAWGFDKRVFFCAVFFNYLCVAGTCVQIFYTLKKYIGDIPQAFCASLLYLLGFGTIFYEVMPLTDAFSVLLFAITFHFYLDRNYLSFIPLIIFVLQREYVFLALGLVALMDYLHYKPQKSFYLHTLLACIFLFTVYFILRKTVFYTPALDHQASPGFLLQSLLEFKVPGFTYVKQAAMTMNLVFIYLGVILFKFTRRVAIERFSLLKLTLLFLQINIICMAGGHGNNMGRYFYIIVPFVIYQLGKESRFFFDSQILNPNER